MNRTAPVRGTPGRDADVSTETDYAALVGLDDGHVLTLASRALSDEGTTRRETRWLEERDAEARLVARYRTWSVRHERPPWRRELGWERWSLTGELLDREVRYSSGASRRALH